MARWKAVIQFATEPDNHREIAAQVARLVEWEQISVDEQDDLAIVLHVVAQDAYEAARVALDRVQAATAETEFAAPELLDVNVVCMYGGIDPDVAR